MKQDDRSSTPSTQPPADKDRSSVSRRSFLQTLGASAAVGAVADQAEAAADTSAAHAPSMQNAPTLGPDPINLTLSINGRKMAAQIDPATTLMETLRWHHKMTGTKEVCDRGSCGACSVMVDGKVVASCMMLAADAEGKDIATVEGLASGDGTLDPIQTAFIKHDALQCGFCTPGLIMATRALLDEHPKPSMDQIRKGLSGNICRCGTYTNIFNAVLDASGQQPIMDDKGGRV